MNNIDPEIDKTKIDNIINKYQTAEKSESVSDKIQKLDRKAEAPGRIVSLLIGILGTLVFGAGMSIVMVFENTLAGIIVSVIGIIIFSPAYFIYKKIAAIQREKYGKEILELAKEL